MGHFWILILILLMGCTKPVYQNTQYGLEEFISDSSQIAKGKQAILQLEDQSLASLEGTQETYEDVLEEGDELNVFLYYPKRPDRTKALNTINKTLGFSVCEGQIQLPELPPLNVAGLTLTEAKECIQQAYREQMAEGEIFLRFKKRRARYVQIIGALNQSLVTVDGKMRLNEVLAKAGLPPNGNAFKSLVVRGEQILPIDFYQLICEGNQSQNIVMRGGDQIFIANAQWAPIMVMGEVPRPQAVSTPYGFMSLRQAIVQAGGIPFTGDKGCIQVIRGNLVRPKIYVLDWVDITLVTNKDLLLIPGDIVYVTERPITHWNRFIGQLQPSFTCLQTGYTSYQLFPTGS